MFRYYARENKLVLMTRVGKDVRDHTTFQIKFTTTASLTPIGEAIASTLTGITLKRLTGKR